MKFLIDIFKKAVKGDSFRSIENPVTYNDGIAKLNSLGSNQYNKLTTQKVNSISKNKSAISPTSNSNTIVPGSR